MRRRVFVVTLALVWWVARVASAGPEEEIRALFERLVAAQNAHDVGSVRDVLRDSPR